MVTEKLTSSYSPKTWVIIQPLHFSMEKEDSGFGASFFAKGTDEAMICIGIY